MNRVNAGAFRYKIGIYERSEKKDSAGFRNQERDLIIIVHAQVKVMRGFTLLVNNSDFEKGYTNFTIRKPRKEIARGMEIDHDGKTYTIEYINPLGVAGELMEMQAKEVTK